MTWSTIITIVIIVLTVIVLKGKYKKTTNKGSPQSLYKKNDALFTPAERSFLGVLNQVIKDDAIIFGKVRVADVLSPIDGLSKKDWQILFNKICSKHFDYIICDKKDLSILCAVELDDKSHNSTKRRERDKLLQDACSYANFPLIQITAKASYNINEIRNKIIEHLESDKQNRI